MRGAFLIFFRLLPLVYLFVLFTRYELYPICPAGSLLAGATQTEHGRPDAGVALDVAGAEVRTVERAIDRTVVVVAEHPRRGRDRSKGRAVSFSKACW